MLKKILYLSVILLVFASCDTLRYTKIEVMLPAEVQYPPEAQKVVLVNNTSPQPGTVGHTTYIERYFMRTNRMKKADVDTINVDSLGFACLYNTANVLNKSNFFNGVEVYPYRTFSSRNYYPETKLDRKKADNIFKSTGADVIISLDRLSYESKIIVREYERQVYEDPTLDVNLNLVWRIHYPNRQQKVERIQVQDSLYWESQLQGMYYRLIPREEAVSEAVWYAGEKSAQKLAPYWSEVERFYFAGGSTHFKLANEYYKKGDWKEAADLWEYIYLSSKKMKKARAALNLAYINEISGDLEKANEWVNKSYEEYRDQGLVYSTEYDLVRSYRKILRQRLNDESRLKTQFGEEEE